MQQSLHDQLMDALTALNNKELKYLIGLLNERKITNYTETAVFIFLLLYQYPEIMNAPNSQKLQKILQTCYIHTTPNQLYALLNKPENQEAKRIFDSFVQFNEQANELELPQKTSRRSV